MASYQDIDTRLREVEAKISFTMKAFAVMRQSPIIGGPPQRMCLLDLYREAVGMTFDGVSSQVDTLDSPPAPVEAGVEAHAAAEVGA